MKTLRKALATAMFLALGAGVQACADSPTAPAGDGDDPQCMWIDGVLHCTD